MDLQPLEPDRPDPDKPDKKSSDARKVRIGDLLTEQGLINDAQLQLALQEQKVSGKKLGRVLVDMGLISESRLLNALSEHLKIPFLEMKHFRIDHEISAKLPETFARRFRALILGSKDNGYLLGMVDPLDILAQDEIYRHLQAPLFPAIIRESELLATMELVYRRTEAIQTIAGELNNELRESDFVLEELATDSTGNGGEAPVVRLLQSILEDAVQVKASDIHIEPDEQGLRVRHRIDGVLQEQFINEKRIAAALVLRLKIMSSLDISEKRLPQDGRFNIKILNRSIDIRLSTMPTQWGETVVMRLLDQSQGILSLDAVGMPEQMQNQFRHQIERPHGLVLVTGPTGSGKTTTLYAALNHLNSPERKIITAEDPIEYRLPRINQVQVNSKIELTFASILRTALRQDPDVMLIGEMRDQETVAIAVRASLTGHLVLSTLHTNDAVSSAIRLADMGVEPWLIASALRVIIAQRLIRRICSNCREQYQPDPQQQIWIEHVSGQQESEKQYWKGHGCYQCNNTGYSGRIGVFEMLELTSPMLSALRQADTEGFRHAVLSDPDFIPMTKSALAYAAEGITTLDEVFRISSDISVITAAGHEA